MIAGVGGAQACHMSHSTQHGAQQHPASAVLFLEHRRTCTQTHNVTARDLTTSTICVQSVDAKVQAQNESPKPWLN